MESPKPAQDGYQPRQLSFYSEILSELFLSTSIQDMSDQTLDIVLSELSATFASVEAVVEEIDGKIAAQIDDIDVQWERRLRKKRIALAMFHRLLKKERAKRARANDTERLFAEKDATIRKKNEIIKEKDARIMELEQEIARLTNVVAMDCISNLFTKSLQEKCHE